MSETIDLLTDHWALDRLAAEHVAAQLDQRPEEAKQLQQALVPISANAASIRDANRQKLANIMTGRSNQKMLVMGPCSLDAETDTDTLFTAIHELQDVSRDVLIVMRGNIAKPRTAAGWKGLWYSTNTSERQRIFDIYCEALERGIPLVCEVTETPQMAALAPYLSGAWIGARDAASTSLRGMAAAFQLPIGVKNGVHGEVSVAEQALAAIGSNTEEIGNSGVDLTRLAATADHPGIALSVVPVSEGNNSTGLIARGGGEMRTIEDGARHLGELCLVAQHHNTAVIVDVSHDLVAAFGSNRKELERSKKTISGLLRLLEGGEIEANNRITGIMTEIGPSIGRTDPNWKLDKESVAFLANTIERFAKVADNA